MGYRESVLGCDSLLRTKMYSLKTESCVNLIPRYCKSKSDDTVNYIPTEICGCHILEWQWYCSNDSMDSSRIGCCCRICYFLWRIDDWYESILRE